MCEREAKMRQKNEEYRKLTPAKIKQYAYNAGFAWAEGNQNGKNGLYLRCECKACERAGAYSFVDYSALDSLTWPQISNHVIGGRHVSHLTRVVGYFSKVENWNESKKSELADRRQGDYKVE